MKTSLVPSQRIAYVELLGRSNFSFLQGASHPEEMAEQAKALGYDGLALCDLNGLYGVVRGYQAVVFPSHFLTPQISVDQPFHFHAGAEMQFLDPTDSKKMSSVALLPMNKEGYSRLCQLITLAKREAPKAYTALTLKDICRLNEDLIALPLPPWNLNTLQTLRLAFEDRLYLPVWKDLTWQSLETYNHALELERQHHFSLVVTQRPFMHHLDRKPLHDVLTCISHGTTLTQARSRLLGNRERHLKPLPELAQLWRERPDLLQRSADIARRLTFDLSELKYQYPHADLPEGMNPTTYLRSLTEKGLSWRFPLGTPDKVYKLVQHELAIIHELAYEDYFLTLYDICEFARRKQILFQGRGSAANSVVCYALGLTAVDPTKVELLFERFISKERGEPPDIDIDFDSARREEVIQYIYEKYGAGHAAMVCTVICYRARLALRDAAKVLGVPLKTIDMMIKYMGRDGLSRLVASPEKAPEWGFTPRQFRLLLDIAGGLKGFPRHLGIHSGGFLVSQRPITECVPVEKATMDKRYVIQWNKDDLTILKMMKIDVLGLGMLGALQRCFELLGRHHKRNYDLSNIPADDKPTYEMIQNADTIGVFQIESRAQMSMLPRLRPDCFYDLVIEVAIIRPGPIQGGMVHPFVRRRHGLEPVTYPHPDLKPILGKTFGVPIFQEQIMQIACTVAGFTPGESDELRRIMSSSWKKSELMAGIRQRLINGMLQHGIQMSYAEQIYQTIVGFASYGFPESHAASFALLTYASCYLKKHYPEAFTCALLNAQPMGFYSPRALIGDAQRHQVKFLPLDIQLSDYDYDLAPIADGKFAIRAGLRAIFGLQEDMLRQLIEERKTNGLFLDLQDLVRRVRLPKSVLLRLASSGALTSLGLSPREALWKIQALELKPESLFFGAARESINEPIHHEDMPEEKNWDQLMREYQNHGFSLTKHPIGLLRPSLKSLPRVVDLKNLPNGRRIQIAGLLSLLQRPPTAKGFAFLNFEDETGLFNVVLTPAVYEKFRLTIAFQQLLVVTGRIEKADGVINIKAEGFTSLAPNTKALIANEGMGTY